MRVVLIVSAVLCWSATSADLFTTTDERIARHGYPCEKHTVVTADGYILQMFRIPHSNRAGNQMSGNKSAVFVLPGMMSSSDIFVMGGPDTDLAFMLPDAGYDVWFGNTRGNEYSQRHTSPFMSPMLPWYWAFSWHEMGYYDLPAMIDYISSKTGKSSLHFVGHCQAATAFMVMLATRPSYNKKIKTSHLLGPPIFRKHIKSRIIIALAPFMERGNELNSLLGASKFLPGDVLIRALLPPICKEVPYLDWCANIAFLIAGGPSKYTNMTLIPEYLETYPADSSTRQHMHYIQEYKSGKFCKYDYGLLGNMAKYGTSQPPDYNLGNVNTAIPIDIYYSDSDQLADLADTRHLESLMGSKLSSHHVVFPEYNHYDFLLASNVREVINDCILDQINESEKKPFKGNLCNNFKK